MKFASTVLIALFAASAAACSEAPQTETPPAPPEAGPAPAAPVLTAQAINDAAYETPPAFEPEQTPVAAVVRAQVLLDRAGFSPGVTDGRFGENVSLAIAEYQRRNDMTVDGQLTQAVWERLTAGQTDDVISRYRLTEADVAGPFTQTIPEGLAAQAELSAMGYRSAAELISERFHMDEDFLRALNPGADFSRAGTEIYITTPRRAAIQGEVARIEVDAEEKAVRAFAEDGRLLAYYPATIGSTENPSPSGSMTVNGVARNPTYTYDPSRVSYANDRVTERLEIAAGPNNPVGAVWIDLSRDTYGIHGTPNPDIVGKNASNGCVRLTNWDVMHLAAAVRPGVEVVFV